MTEQDEDTIEVLEPDDPAEPADDEVVEPKEA